METSALNASNVEQAFTTLIKNIYDKKKLKAVDIQPVRTPVEHEPTSRIPIVSDPIIEITPNPIRLKRNQESKTRKKSRC